MVHTKLIYTGTDAKFSVQWERTQLTPTNWNDSAKTVNKSKTKHMVNVLSSDIHSTKKVHWKKAKKTFLPWKDTLMFKINYQQRSRLQKILISINIREDIKKIEILPLCARPGSGPQEQLDWYSECISSLNEKANHPQQQFSKDIYSQWTSCFTGRLMSK